jgi:hypothetical protein
MWLFAYIWQSLPQFTAFTAFYRRYFCGKFLRHCNALKMRFFDVYRITAGGGYKNNKNAYTIEYM